ncbi:ADP-ribosylation factor [Babesia ovis]|uniref:ADP-ribosylation factor n=1 Tax=Babesia ovis TaxID=5869 RepID=A0A9W5TCN8_BABOV|nr:ADP-ribosylation factor [Babesia ovis]
MLGVHISQVKSLTLDNLKPEWTKVLCEVGNDLANQYYLHKLPARVPKPNANTSPKEMEIWIRNKYERKIYAMDGVEEPYILLAKGYNPREVIMRGSMGQGARQQPAERAPKDTFEAGFGGRAPEFNPFDANKAKSTPDDLFGNRTAQNAPFDPFQDNTNAPKWSGDFWPTASGNNGQSASFDDDMIRTVASSTSFESSKLSETKIEAAKDSISKLFENPTQIGFKNSSYPQNTPNCVQGDLFDFNFSTLGNKLDAQKRNNDDLI